MKTLGCSPFTPQPRGYALYEGERQDLGTTVLVDLDHSGDDREGTDAVVLTDRNGDGRVEIPDLATLATTDRDGDGKVRGEELNAVFLWYDNDKNGRFNSGDGLDMLGDEEVFPTASIDIRENRLFFR